MEIKRQKIESNPSIQQIKILRIMDNKVRFQDGYEDLGITSYFLSCTDENNISGIYGPFGYNIALVLQSFLVNIDNNTLTQWTNSKKNVQQTRHYQSGVGKIALGIIDCCLTDLLAKQADIPAYKLFNDSDREYIETYWSNLNSSDMSDRTMEEGKNAYSRGFHKQKWGGTGKFWYADIDNLFKKTSQYMNPKNLMVDFKRQFSVNEANILLEPLQYHDHLFLEEPFCHQSSLTPTKFNSNGLSIAYGEHTYSTYEAIYLIESIKPDYFQPDIVWFGGIAEVLECINHIKHLQIIPHGGSFLPAIHLGFTCNTDTVPMIEYSEKLERRRQHFYLEKTLPSNAFIKKPSSNGWGISVDRKRANEFYVRSIPSKIFLTS
jgi:L-alanine-DL-glutamate epimerase-like enolase superfamily enzyme